MPKASIISIISFSFNASGILFDVFFLPPSFKGTADGAFEAFYDNSVKLSTTNTGIDVAGAIEIDKTLTMAHTADPSDPATGKSVMWSDTSGNLKVKINVAGTVVTRTLAAYED